MTSQIVSILLLIFGFGFVIFFHELGHFLAAKWVGVKVEQFAVGFGHALLAWRKGIGLRVGTTQPEFMRRIEEHLAAKDPDRIQSQDKTELTEQQIHQAATELDLGETEYRLNWIPLGGYVKMLGQDDLRPNAQQDDPRAYNKKSIRARMLVVSAGVIMNIILAAIGFMVVFLMGFRAPPAVVGSVQIDSPASKTTRTVDGKTVSAPLQGGDRILYFDGKYQHDFTKITLNTALAEEGSPVPMLVKRADGTEEHLTILPRRQEQSGFLMLGIGQPFELRGLGKREALTEAVASQELLPKDALTIKAGDIITHVNGEAVKAGGPHDEFWKFDRAVQNSAGKPVQLTVRAESGEVRNVDINPIFEDKFGEEPIDFAGMLPRTTIHLVSEDSPARGKLMPGDVIVRISFPNGDSTNNPSADVLIKWLDKAGQSNQAVQLVVERDGDEKSIEPIMPVKLPTGRRGLAIQLRPDPTRAAISEVLDKSVAKAAGIPANSRITAINGNPVESWFDVRQQLAHAAANKPVAVELITESGPSKVALNLNSDEIEQIDAIRYTTALTYIPVFVLHERVEPRKTSSPLVAAAWGVTETHDFVLQFYLTLQRMFQGSVSYKNMMGPVGIFDAGRRFAYKGNDWLIWFLAMISANLAVVNFLPIPIVDGGLFLFLIIEKIQGRPLSPKTQSIAQVVGLAVILSVFLLVTYQDIARFL